MEFSEINEDKLSGGCKKHMVSHHINKRLDDSRLYLIEIVMTELSNQRYQQTLSIDETLYGLEEYFHVVIEAEAMKSLICKLLL